MFVSDMGVAGYVLPAFLATPGWHIHLPEEPLLILPKSEGRIPFLWESTQNKFSKCPNYLPFPFIQSVLRALISHEYVLMDLFIKSFSFLINQG